MSQRSGDVWRLLVHPRADGAWNMAVDEALLESRDRRPDGPPTLRLYGWRPAAVSLGRSQRADAVDAAYLRAQAIDLVRRPSGGAAVLHDAERTYAVIGCHRRAPFHGGVIDTYERLAVALVRALRDLGVAAHAVAGGAETARDAVACFGAAVQHEIAAGGRKLIGSAQLRRRQAFLQHGSILLRADAERTARALAGPVESERFSDLARELGAELAEHRLDGAIVRAFAEAFGVRLEPGRLSAQERQRAAELRSWKYESVAWTLAGHVGARERRWGPALR